MDQAHKTSAQRWREAHPNYSKEWAKSHREYYRVRAKAQYRKNPAKAAAAAKKYRQNNPDYFRVAGWKRLGISNPDISVFRRLLVEQDRRCAICGKLVDESGCWDHDHESGMTRGILCKPCNLVLGNADDNDSILERAAAYLKAWRKLK